MIIFTDHVPEYLFEIKKVSGISMIIILTLVTVVYLGMIIFPITKKCLESIYEKITKKQDDKRVIKEDAILLKRIKAYKRVYDKCCEVVGLNT